MSLALHARLECIATGRHWVTAQAARCGARPVQLATITLLASEAVANAVLHGPAGGPIAVRARATDGVFRVEVDDDGAALPEVRHPEPHDLGGRGMLLIDTYATRWGYELRDGGGKTMWFECRL